MVYFRCLKDHLEAAVTATGKTFCSPVGVVVVSDDIKDLSCFTISSSVLSLKYQCFLFAKNNNIRTGRCINENLNSLRELPLSDLELNWYATRKKYKVKM